jgi:hypothetical protein
MHGDRFDQAFFAEWFSQVLVGTDQFAAGTVKQAVLAGQHDHRRIFEFGVILDERARLIPVQTRHHDIDEDNIGFVVDHLGQAVETIFRQDDLASRLGQEYLTASTYGVAIVYEYHSDTSQTFCHFVTLFPD